MDVAEGLPYAEDHGTEGAWRILDRDGREILLKGRFLGMGTSHRPQHKGHRAGTWAPRGEHCSTCRWTEIRIFSRTDGGFYIVNCGASEVPGERDLVRVIEVGTPFEAVEKLANRDRSGSDRRPFLPVPARFALAQAAAYDESLRDAYINSPMT